MIKYWKLSRLDSFCLSMTIKGAWTFKSLPSFHLLKDALVQLISYYPQLNGTYDRKLKSVVYEDQSLTDVDFWEKECFAHLCSENPYQLVPDYDIKGFKSGRVKAIRAWLLHLKDGDVLVVQGAHALMDGFTFYNLIKQWGELVRGKSIIPMVVDQSVLPSYDRWTKEEVLHRVVDAGWVKMTLSRIVKSLYYTYKSFSIKKQVIVEVTQEDIVSLKAKTGVGTNAVLCAIASEKLLEWKHDLEDFSILLVSEKRKLVENVPENFFGNFSQPLQPIGPYNRSLTVEDLAICIQNDVRAAMKKDRNDEIMSLTEHASHYRLPYNYFDPSQMNGPNPQLIAINNQLSLPAHDVDFGMGQPLRVEEAELSDFIKFWQPVPGGAVQIIFRGYAAKILGTK